MGEYDGSNTTGFVSPAADGKARWIWLRFWISAARTVTPSAS